jgi:iron complex transport system substrate-binding protein
MRLRWLALMCAGAGLCMSAAAITVLDDHGRNVSLKSPARRVVSLAPHGTELVFAAGGGDRLVGVVEYSDFPDAAKRIRRIGDNEAVDLEAITALKPDLIIVWRHGNARRQVDKLQALAVPVFESEPKRLEDIPGSIERLGALLGTEAAARAEATRFRQQYARLREQYADRPPVRSFYQVWRQPLMTLNDTHMISDLIRLCGGVNVFGKLGPLVPTLSDEAVIEADPEFMFTAAPGATASERSLDGLDSWRRFPRLLAVSRANLFQVNGDLINRPTPRILQAAELVCEAMEGARRKRP